MADTYLYPVTRLLTKGYHGYSTKFSPHNEDVIAVSGAENFGIRGNGCLTVFNTANSSVIWRGIYSNALFDLCWSVSDRNIILTGAGDGCAQIWGLNKSSEKPILNHKIHEKEVSSLQCCPFDPEYVASSSWDSSVVMCNVNNLQPTCVLRGHQGMVYEAIWSPQQPRQLASVSEDGRALIWCPFASPKPSMSLPSIDAELLSCDWSHSEPNLVVTASTSALLQGWDLREPSAPVFQLQGHENAIRKVRFSPFLSYEIASVAYDFTTRLWDVSLGVQTFSSKNHSEFVYGLCYSHLVPGVIADCAWDQTVQVYKAGPPPPTYPGRGNVHSVGPLQPTYPGQGNVHPVGPLQPTYSGRGSVLSDGPLQLTYPGHGSVHPTPKGPDVFPNDLGVRPLPPTPGGNIPPQPQWLTPMGADSGTSTRPLPPLPNS